MVERRKVELRFPLEGLLAMESAEDLVYDVESLVESEYALSDGTTVRPAGSEALQKLSMMKDEINQAGAGYDMRVELELIASDAEE